MLLLAVTSLDTALASSQMARRTACNGTSDTYELLPDREASDLLSCHSHVWSQACIGAVKAVGLCRQS
jgi:hypothetical protein